MTKKVLTYSFAAAALLSGCADDFQNYEAAQVEGGKGKLVEAGLIGGSVLNGTDTRAYSPKGKFVWMPEQIDPSTGVVIDGRQEIGLCWTGVNTENPDFGAIKTVGENVYTNYKFVHTGWMFKDAVNVERDECKNYLLNGAYFQGEAPSGAKVALFEGTYTGSTYSKRWNGYYYGAQEGKYGTGANDKLNLGAGVFKTENSSVFEGQYIVYFPYTDKFTKGAIIASQPESFNIDCGDDKYATYSKYAFLAGVQGHYGGGNSQSSFNTGIYSSSVTIAVQRSKEGYFDKEIKRVILYSKDNGIVYETGISAASIVSAKNPDGTYDMTKVTTVGEPKKTNAIFADLTNTTVPTPGYHEIRFQGNEVHDLITIPVLPQTTDLSVILVDTDEKTYKYEAETKSYDLKAGGNQRIVVKAKEETDFTATYYAVNEVSFADALKKVNAAAANTHNRITLLCDIKMISDNDTEYSTSNTVHADKNLTIQADASSSDARLIVTSGTTRDFTVNSDYYFNINVPVLVEGFGCCSDTRGTLNIYPTSKAWNDVAKLTFNSDVINYGITNINFDAANEVINFNGKVINGWDDEYVRKTTRYSYGTWQRKKAGGVLTVNNANSNENVVKLYLNGGIENDATVNFGSASTPALASADALGKRTLRVTTKNIVNAGKKKNGVSTASSAADVPGGLLEINNNVLVTVTEGISNNNEFGIIHVVGTGLSDTNDGRLDVKKSEASSNNGTIDNDGVINLMGSGNLDNSNGLFLDNLTGQVGGKPVNNGAARTAGDYSIKYKQGIHAQANTYQTDLNDGIYATKTATNYRLSFILNDLVESKSCNVIDIVDADDAVDGGFGYDLTLPEYNGKDLAGYDVRINAYNLQAGVTPLPRVDVRFIYGEKDPEDGYKFVGSKSLGHCMDVYTNVVLDRSNEFTIENNLFVRGTGNLVENDKLAFFHVANKIEVEVGGDLTVNATTGSPVKFATSSRGIRAKDIMNSGAITTNETFTVDNDFNINYNNSPVEGILTANGTDNTVGNNFNLWGEATFAAKTTTIINGTFNSYGAGSLITRLGIGATNAYRATVNCDTLGATQGNAVGGWPTEF